MVKPGSDVSVAGLLLAVEQARRRAVIQFENEQARKQVRTRIGIYLKKKSQ